MTSEPAADLPDPVPSPKRVISVALVLGPPIGFCLLPIGGLLAKPFDPSATLVLLGQWVVGFIFAPWMLLFVYVLGLLPAFVASILTLLVMTITPNPLVRGVGAVLSGTLSTAVAIAIASHRFAPSYDVIEMSLVTGGASALVCATLVGMFKRRPPGNGGEAT